MRKINVVGTIWHTAHQFYLAQLDFIERYDLVVTSRTWGHQQRPFPKKCNLIPHIPVDHDYDLAILHIDQQVVEPRISKGSIFFDLFSVVRERKIPTVAINHMTPFSDRVDSRVVIEKVKRLLGDTPMVTNSKEAARQWGWGYPIIHGMKVDDWWDLPKEPRIVTVLSGAGMEKAYRRSFLRNVISTLEEDFGEKLIWIGGGAPHRESFDDYRDFLGRTLIYFNPTFSSPMPRARTEAMLSGACIVSTPTHDWEEYITHGKNGFLVEFGDVKGTVKLLVDLLRDYQRAYEVGQEGKKAAREYFSFERWQEDWRRFVFNEVLT